MVGYLQIMAGYHPIMLGYCPVKDKMILILIDMKGQTCKKQEGHRQEAGRLPSRSRSPSIKKRVIVPPLAIHRIVHNDMQAWKQHSCFNQASSSPFSAKKKEFWGNTPTCPFAMDNLLSINNLQEVHVAPTCTYLVPDMYLSSWYNAKPFTVNKYFCRGWRGDWGYNKRT